MELDEFIELVDTTTERLRPRLDPLQAEIVAQHSSAGAWDEAVDVLVATVLRHRVPVTPAERDDLRRLLADLGLPVARLDGLHIHP